MLIDHHTIQSALFRLTQSRTPLEMFAIQPLERKEIARIINDKIELDNLSASKNFDDLGQLKRKRYSNIKQDVYFLDQEYYNDYIELHKLPF